MNIEDRKFKSQRDGEQENSILPGSPMTEETLLLRIQFAKERIQSGHFTTQEELEKEMKKW